MGALTDIIKKSKDKIKNPDREDLEKKRKKRKRRHSDEFEEVDYSKLKLRNSNLDQIKDKYKAQKST